MKEQKRGRPKGSSSKNLNDERILADVTDIIIRGSAKNPTAAIKQVIGEGQASDLRRLQRKWTLEGESLIVKAQAPFWKDRWNREAKALKEAAPELYERFSNFAKSKGGAEMLLEKGDDGQPIHFMSLGMVSLNEWLKKTTMHGSDKAQKEFPKILSHWGKFGVAPDTEFLRAFAQLCMDKANELEAEQAEKEKGGKS